MIFAMLSTYFRSFFVQTLWNFERLQNIGFAFGVAPLLKRSHDSQTAYLSALRRHMTFFNTHPYFAPIVMGVVYQKEAAQAEFLDEKETTTLVVLKDSMGGAFGAVGDHVIWGTWRPFCAIMALSIGMLVAYPLAGHQMQPSLFDVASAKICAKWWVAGFLGIFNSVHLWLRWRGLQKAVHEGPLVVRWVQSLHLQAWASQIRRIGLLLMVIMIMVYFARWTSSQMLLWMIAVLLGTVIMKRWGVPSYVLFYLVCGVSVAMTFFGIHWP
jgi:PTS system mannose-specific IID component